MEEPNSKARVSLARSFAHRSSDVLETALMGRLAGWLRGECKVRPHELFALVASAKEDRSALQSFLGFNRARPSLSPVR